MSREWDDTITGDEPMNKNVIQKNVIAEENREGNKEENEQQNEAALLKQLLKKQLFYTRITALAGVGFLAVVCVALALVLPKTITILDEVSVAVEMAETTITNANTALEDISVMSESITTVSTEMETFLTENSQTVVDAMDDISAIDFEGLNNAIQDLEDIVEPFANMMNRFK